MSGHLRHNWGKSIILSLYYFAPAIIPTFLSYTKTVKIAAMRNVFSTKNSLKCFCGRGSALDPAGRTLNCSRLLVSWGWKNVSHSPPLSYALRRLNSHQRLGLFDSRRLDTLWRCSGTHNEKSAPMSTMTTYTTCWQASLSPSPSGSSMKLW